MLIGRKLYISWSETLTVGLGRFLHVPGELSDCEPFESALLEDLSWSGGELVSGGSCDLIKLDPELWSLETIFTDSRGWVRLDEAGSPKPFGFCGRRLWVPIGDGVTACMDKIVGLSLSSLGLSTKGPKSVKLVDVSLFDGSLIEHDLGLPKVSPYGKTIEQIWDESSLYWEPESSIGMCL